MGTPCGFGGIGMVSLSLNPVAATLLAELHGRMGYFPAALRMSWGSGHEAVTVAYALRDTEMARSRRLTDDGHPLGWAQLAIFDEQGQPFKSDEE